MQLDYYEIVRILFFQAVGPLLLFAGLLILLRKDIDMSISRVKEGKPLARDYVLFGIFISPIVLFIGWDIFSNYFSEMIAGIIGIMYGFSLQKKSEEAEEKEMMDLIQQNMIVELYENLDIIQNIQAIDLDNSYIQFKVTVWELFQNRLKFDSLDIMFEIGSLYHRFTMFNNCMNFKGSTFEISGLFINYPNFLDILQNDINAIIRGFEE